MKYSSYLVLGISIVALLNPSVSFGQQLKIASVDMSKVFTEYYKTKKAEAELKDQADGFGKELRDKASDLQKMEEDGKKLHEEASNPAFTEEKKAEKQKLFDTKRNEFRLLANDLNQLKQAREKELKDRQNKVRSAIVDEITKIIQEKAKREGYSMVVDKTGLTLSGVPPFIFVQDSLDITADVIRTLNATAPASAPSKEPKK
jgi:outer membrane protein